MDGGHITESTVAEDGGYSLTLPAVEAVQVAVFDEGTVRLTDQTVNPETATADLMLPPVSRLRISTFSNESMERVPVPARIQVRPVEEPMIGVPGEFGEESPANSRLHNLLEVDGTADVVVPPGRWEVIVSRGYEYELFSTEVEVSVGSGPIDVVADLVRSVPTPGMLCADFHIHTRRSNDSGDDARYKVAGALADGLEIPVRSDHEYVGDFQELIEEVSMQQWAYGMPSVELTTMQVYGHFGVIPAVAVDDVINAGSPVWQRYPTVDNPDQAVENILPPELFAQVRARPEAPAIIINHPRGATNYFGAAGFDSETGEVSRPEYWDTEFQAVEVFNDSGWLGNRDGTVNDWLTLLNTGRRVFAVGSSDSHNQRTSPVGYPRTCLELGTDSPMEATAEIVRDAMKEGHSTVSGGIYVYTRVGDVGPGRDAVGLGATATMNIQVYAASWVDVDSLELIVDGETIMTVPVPDAPAESTLRLDQDFEIAVSEAGSYALAAAYGDASLAPVHPGREAFGVANPIFLTR
jgi:hypothetical protein